MYGSTAAKIRKEKDLYPERFCPSLNCLWRTGGGYCRKHAPSPFRHGATDEFEEAERDLIVRESYDS